MKSLEESISHVFGTRSAAYTQVGDENTTYRPNSSRKIAIISIGSLALLLLFGIFIQSPSLFHSLPSALPHHSSELNVTDTARLHLLVPATSSGLDLCKLFLSMAVLGYPTPTLINWGAHEDKDPYVQHLAKVQTILKNLRELQKRPGIENDLVLAIDGYDIWFQLPPDVLLKRYHAVNEAALKRTIDTYGPDIVRNKDMRQTVLFGPDKLCWPVHFEDPRCWAVPPAALDKYAFGPLTNDGPGDTTRSMPQWLNSGTIMGPVDDMIELFEVTLFRIKNYFTEKSDQLYFAEVWGIQEYARLSQVPSLLDKVKKAPHPGERLPKTGRTFPNVTTGVEYHIGLDYGSSLFQTIAMYTKFLSWTRARRPHHLGTLGEADVKLQSFYGAVIPEDLWDSSRPFAYLQDHGIHDQTTWEDVDLCYNTASREIPVLLHFTGEKGLRNEWWEKMWFQRRGDELRKAVIKSDTDQQQLSSTPINGKLWFGAQPGVAAVTKTGNLGFAWTDMGAWVSWDGLCEVYEPTLYNTSSLAHNISMSAINATVLNATALI